MQQFLSISHLSAQVTSIHHYFLWRPHSGVSRGCAARRSTWSSLVLHYNSNLSGKLKSNFCVFYLDDGTVGGSANDVLHDLDPVEEEACHLGLHLNHEKSELICDDLNAGNLMLSVSWVFPWFHVTRLPYSAPLFAVRIQLMLHFF